VLRALQLQRPFGIWRCTWKLPVQRAAQHPHGLFPATPDVELLYIPVPLTKYQRQVLQLVYDAYCRHGEWPDFGTLDRRVARLKRLPDLGLLVRDLPIGLLLPIWSGSIRPQADAKMKLTVRGLAECEGVQG
jgi:hypothetical protein